MKNLKIVLGTLLLVIGGLSVSSFVAKSYDKDAFTRVCYYFNVPAAQLSLKDAVGADKNLVEGIFKEEDNWTVLAGDPPTNEDCIGGQFLCAICFDDAQHTLTSALAIAWTTYATPGGSGFTQAQDVDPNSSRIVNVYLQPTTANH